MTIVVFDLNKIKSCFYLFTISELTYNDIAWRLFSGFGLHGWWDFVNFFVFTRFGRWTNQRNKNELTVFLNLKKKTFAGAKWLIFIEKYFFASMPLLSSYGHQIFAYFIPHKAAALKDSILMYKLTCVCHFNISNNINIETITYKSRYWYTKVKKLCL